MVGPINMIGPKHMVLEHGPKTSQKQSNPNPSSGRSSLYGTNFSAFQRTGIWSYFRGDKSCAGIAIIWRLDRPWWVLWSGGPHMIQYTQSGLLRWCGNEPMIITEVIWMYPKFPTNERQGIKRSLRVLGSPQPFYFNSTQEKQLFLLHLSNHIIYDFFSKNI